MPCQLQLKWTFFAFFGGPQRFGRPETPYETPVSRPFLDVFKAFRKPRGAAEPEPLPNLDPTTRVGMRPRLRRQLTALFFEHRGQIASVLEARQLGGVDFLQRSTEIRLSATLSEPTEGLTCPLSQLTALQFLPPRGSSLKRVVYGSHPQLELQFPSPFSCGTCDQASSRL